MKKISIFLALVALVMTLFAINVFAASFTRGPEGDTITAEDIESFELLEGSKSAKGEPKNLIDGQGNTYWAGASGNGVKITFVNEWEITKAEGILAGNWCYNEWTFYAADGTVVGKTKSNCIQANYDYLYGGDATNADRINYSEAVNGVSYGDNDKAVKYMTIKTTGDKWGYLPNIFEVFLTGRERVPSVGCDNHEFEPVYTINPTCTTAGSMVNTCTKCGAQEAAIDVPALGHNMGEYSIKVPATCVSAPVLEFVCTRENCGATIERDANVNDVTDYGDEYSITGVAGGGTDFRSIFDNNIDSYGMASGSWYVEGAMNLDMPYYISSVTVWVGVGRYDSTGNNNCAMIFYYQAPGSDEWIEGGKVAVDGTYLSERYEYILELDTPVRADAIKIYVGDSDGTPNSWNGLESYNGCVYEVEVAGSIVEDVAAGHNWIETEVIAPDCDDFGYTEYTCDICFDSKIADPVKETGHTWVDADCFAPKTCSVCAATTGDPKGHKVTHVDAVAATCFENGNIEYWYCEVCGYAWADAELTQVTNLKSVVTPMAHGTITHVEAKAATCFEDGNIEYWFCEACGYAWLDADCTLNTNLKAVVLPMAHGTITHVDAVAATCFENGNIEYWYCEACGYAWLDADCTLNTNLKAVVLPMAHGTITHVDAVAATCFENGNIEYWYCEVCGYAWLDADCTLNTNLKAVVLPMAHGTITHVEAKAATCTETGNIEYWYCEACGYAWLDADCTLNTNLKAVVLPTAHSETVIIETVEPNCTTEGSVTTICSVCNAVISTEVLPVAHNWSDTPEDIVPATCISKGTAQYFCVDCWAYDEERGVVETPINPSNHADMAFNGTWTFASCPDCGAFEFYGTHNAFEGETHGYTFYFMSGSVNIYTSDYSFDEYYGYNVISVVDGVYTIELVDHADYDHTTFLGAVATVSFNAREQMYIELVSGETTYKFGADPNAEVLPDVIDNSALNGTYAYYDIGGNVQVMFKFEDGIIYVLEDNMFLGLPESFNYEFNVTQGTIDTGDYDINLMYELGDLYFGRYFYLAPVEEAPEMPEPDDEIGEEIGTMDVETTDTYGFFDLYSYTATEAGKYTFFVPAGLGFYSKAQYDAFGPAEADFYENLGGTYASFDLAAGETLEFYVGALERAEWNLVVFYLANHECSFVEISRVESTCTTAGSVTYECNCGETYTESLPLAAHTEQEIPAVLPTPSVQGYTAGTECSVCGAVVKAPVAVNVTVLADTKDPAFRIAAASLSAKENISVNYKVAATEGYNGVYMVFVFNGKEYIVTEYTVEASTGRLAFKFDQTFPQLMADNIEAYAYAETAEGEYSRNCILEYSVMQYIENQLKKNNAALTTVMSDMLYMGAMTQMKQSYKTDALVTDLIAAKGYTLTPSAFNGIPADVNVQAVTGDRTSGYDWKSGSLAMGAQTQVILKFEAADIEGLVAKLEIAGRIYEYDVAELGKDGNRYVIYFDMVNSYEYNEVITATFEKNGEQVGSTLTYSINTFLQRNYENSKSYGVNDRNLMKALYTYGESILAYFG